MKNLKKWHEIIEITVFLRMNIFWQNRGMKAVYFNTEWTFFWQNMGMRADIFREKSEKNGILLTFMAHNIL